MEQYPPACKYSNRNARILVKRAKQIIRQGSKFIKMNRTGKVVTLLYHRVTKLKNDKNLLAVNPDFFYEQMFYIKRNYPIVRFEQDWNKLNEEAICITFDDGYMDNFTNALPILQELDIPATIFIATAGINTYEELWWDELERILLDRCRQYKETFSLEDDFFSCQWPTKTFADREELYDTLHWLMYDKISVAKRLDWMRQIRDWSKAGNIGRKENQVIQFDENIMQSSLLTIGAHTVNHPSLKNLRERDQRYEIVQSIKALELLFKKEVTVFSYPFGTKNDYDGLTINICKEENIKKAAANIPGIWSFRCDPYQIPRNIVRDWNLNEFIQKIDSFWRLG